MKGTVKRPTYQSFRGKRHSHNYMSEERRKLKNAQAREFRRRCPPLVIRAYRAGKPLEYEGIKKGSARVKSNAPVFMRREDGRIEWQCEHGVGHSDIEQAKKNPRLQTGIHGCCHESCCTKPEFQKAVAEEKLRYDKELCIGLMRRHGFEVEFRKVG